jgi:hypothetical protein
MEMWPVPLILGFLVGILCVVGIVWFSIGGARVDKDSNLSLPDLTDSGSHQGALDAGFRISFPHNHDKTPSPQSSPISVTAPRTEVKEHLSGRNVAHAASISSFPAGQNLASSLRSSPYLNNLPSPIHALRRSRPNQSSVSASGNSLRPSKNYR